jgi:uncharacterized protein (TIGR03067 family)
MRPYFALLLLGLCFPCSMAFGDEAKKELDRLQGHWKVEKGEHSGNPIPEDAIQKIKIEVKGDRMIATIDGNVVEISMKLDPSTKPKIIDLTTEVGDDKGMVKQAIYELSGDEWKVCVDNNCKDRPTAFTTKADADQVLVVMKRVK